VRVDLRPAKTGDRLAIYALMEMSHGSAAYAMAPMDPAKCIAHIDGCMREGFAMVGDVNDEVVGCLLGAENAPWFSSQKRASDLFTYVDPDYRRTGLGLRLYRAFRAWAHERNLKVSLGQLTGVETERMERLFERFGLTKMGASYIEV